VPRCSPLSCPRPLSEFVSQNRLAILTWRRLDASSTTSGSGDAAIGTVQVGHGPTDRHRSGSDIANDLVADMGQACTRAAGASGSTHGDAPGRCPVTGAGVDGVPVHPPSGSESAPAVGSSSGSSVAPLAHHGVDDGSDVDCVDVVDHVVRSDPVVVLDQAAGEVGSSPSAQNLRRRSLTVKASALSRGPSKRGLAVGFNDSPSVVLRREASKKAMASTLDKLGSSSGSASSMRQRSTSKVVPMEPAVTSPQAAVDRGALRQSRGSGGHVSIADSPSGRDHDQESTDMERLEDHAALDKHKSSVASSATSGVSKLYHRAIEQDSKVGSTWARGHVVCVCPWGARLGPPCQ
jgi:hypothetical protein